MQSPTMQSITHVGSTQAKRVTNAIRHADPRTATTIPEPPLARFLFADRRMAWFWLIVRVYAGYTWFAAGWEKLTGTSIDFGTFGQKSSPWVFTSNSGAAMKGFVTDRTG